MRKITIIGLTLLGAFINICSTVLFYQEAGRVVTRDIQIQDYFTALPSFQKDNYPKLKKLGKALTFSGVTEQSSMELTSITIPTLYSTSCTPYQAELATNKAAQKKSIDIQVHIERQLKEDKLVKDIKNYRFKLTKRFLKINRKKQPAAIHQKYVVLYESLLGIKMSEKQTYAVTVNSN